MKKRTSKYEKKLAVREDVTFDDLISIAAKKPIKKDVDSKNGHSTKK